MSATSIVELTKVVVRFEPFHCTTAPGTNPDPRTANLKLAAAEVFTDAGKSELIEGLPFGPGEGNAKLLRNRMTSEVSVE